MPRRARRCVGRVSPLRSTSKYVQNLNILYLVGLDTTTVAGYTYHSTCSHRLHLVYHSGGLVAGATSVLIFHALY